ncbi:VOC family protein [Gordonia sp. CPCC 205515]|uniref:VOC family protein n=1 Tax=Gordonia sp. CPCC 205515 TaxID=3140791 RepID=UPI003AF3E771
MTTTSKVADLAMVSLDCADASVAAEFWAAVLGWEIVASGDGYAMLKGADGAAMGFASIPDYQPPTWPNPNGTKQFHFDLAVDDLSAAQERCIGLGATEPAEQPGDTWRVLFDPSGHPFCLTKKENWG